jgi:hypothetical protein
MSRNLETLGKLNAEVMDLGRLGTNGSRVDRMDDLRSMLIGQRFGIYKVYGTSLNQIVPGWTQVVKLTLDHYSMILEYWLGQLHDDQIHIQSLRFSESSGAGIVVTQIISEYTASNPISLIAQHEPAIIPFEDDQVTLILDESLERIRTPL